MMVGAVLVVAYDADPECATQKDFNDDAYGFCDQESYSGRSHKTEMTGVDDRAMRATGESSNSTEVGKY